MDININDRLVNDVLRGAECSEFAYSEEYANFIFRYDYNIDATIERAGGECAGVISDRFAVVYKSLKNMKEISFSEFGYNAIPQCFGLMDSTSIISTNVDKVRNVSGLSLRGAGVLVAVIDTGINYTLDAFKNQDGTSRIVSIWDQTQRDISKGDRSQIPYGTIYSNAQINAAINSDDPYSIVPEEDEIGHGTFLTSIVAGNENLVDDFSGMAPNSDIVVVKLKQAKQYLRDFYMVKEGATCYQEDDIMYAIRYVLGVAAVRKQPVAICLGMGTSMGDHNGNSYLERYIGIVSSINGIVVVTPCGNELGYGGHYSSLGVAQTGQESITQPPTLAGASRTTDVVELTVGENDSGFTMEIWSRPPTKISVGLVSPTGESYETLPSLDTGPLRIPFLYEGTDVFYENRKIEINSGNQLIFLRFVNPAAGTWKILVHKKDEDNVDYDIWLPINQFMSSDTKFLRGEPNETLTSPGDGDKAITVAAYNHIDNSMYVNSSRGYTISGKIKPDITAAGVNVYGVGKDGSYTTMSGTSVAAAHTAGAVALLLEWGYVKGNKVDINSEVIKQLLISGARRTPGVVYPNRSQGWGYLDIYGVFEELRN